MKTSNLYEKIVITNVKTSENQKKIDYIFLFACWLYRSRSMYRKLKKSNILKFPY